MFARHLALALEFQLAADMLSTAVAPTWERIGKLAAIAGIGIGSTTLEITGLPPLRIERAAR